ncbi:hypothetical protein ACFE04_003962 [Oxalis oulophora]
MFDGLMKPKFYTKSKSSLKIIKTRLEVIKKKRSAVQRFVKNDVAELLRNGFDYNALGRADVLLVEQKVTSCYEDVEKFCEIIYSQLSTMQKQRECPDECKQAVSCLNYAAARLADLPELRDLRTMLTEKYGDSLQPFINKEFIEKLNGNPPTDEMKLQLMYEVANEFSIKCDFKALEKKLFNPAPSANDQLKQRHLKDDAGYKRGKSNNKDSPKRERSHDKSKNKDSPKRERSHDKSKNKDSPKRERSHDPQNRLNDPRLQAAPKRSATDNKHRLSSSSTAKEAGPSSLGNGSEKNIENNKPSHNKLQPLPYFKSNLSKEDDQAPEKMPKPMSVRRRSTDDAREKSREPRRHHLQTINDQVDEEERKMDKLLLHYCKKKSPYETGQDMEHLKLKLQPKQADGPDMEHLKLKQGEGRHRSVKSELPFPRVGSLPPETSHRIKPTAKHLRARSIQPEMLAGHVHPKLPEYDDMAARIKALRG